MNLRARLPLICVLLSMVGCDEESDPSADASVRADGGGLDARVELDARTTIDASAGCQLDQTYRFGFEGGLVAWTDHFTIDRGYLVKSRESTARFDAGNGSCRVLLDECDGLASAFANADVLAAYSDQEEVLGNDPRIVDGSVLVIEREDGKKIVVGSGCNGASNCTPIPAGVQTLRTALTKRIQEYDFAPADAGAGLCR